MTIWMTIYVYIYIYIYSPTPVGLSSLAKDVIVLPLAFVQSSSSVKRMYVNNSNCDS